jgi:hypothetical protein
MFVSLNNENENALMCYENALMCYENALIAFFFFAKQEVSHHEAGGKS